MAVLENQLDEHYTDFCKYNGRLSRRQLSNLPDVYFKRLLYYCKSRRWIGSVLDIHGHDGLKLQRFLAPDQKIYIINEIPNPTRKVYTGGGQQFHFVFRAVSPLLQKVISFRLWPQQVSRARDIVVDLRKTISDKKIPLVEISGSVGLSWPHTDLLLQRGKAVICEQLSPDIGLSHIMLIPGLHCDDGNLTWWRGLADYCTGYIAVDEGERFMTGGVCIAKIEQRLTNNCQLRVLNDDGRWSRNLFRFHFAGYRSRDVVRGGGARYSVLFLREFDEKTGTDQYWIQDVSELTFVDLTLHLIMRKLHHVYLESARLQLVGMKDLESLGNEYTEIAGRVLRERQSDSRMKIPVPAVVKMLLSRYYRGIKGSLYFVPPGMTDEPDALLDVTVFFLIERVTELKMYGLGHLKGALPNINCRLEGKFAGGVVWDGNSASRGEGHVRQQWGRGV